MRRVVYVGITRAKHSLYIYNDISFLDSQPTIVVTLSMADVWLDYFRNHKEEILRLRSGEKINYRDGYLISQQGRCIACLSIAMRERMKNYEGKGYRVTDAEVSYVLAWRPREEPQEVAVCLANLTLEKTDR